MRKLVIAVILLHLFSTAAAQVTPEQNTNASNAVLVSFPGEVLLIDGTKLKGTVTQGKSRTRVINPYFGTNIVLNTHVKSFKDLTPSVKTSGEIVSERIATGTPLPNEDRITEESSKYIAAILKKSSQLKGLTNIAVKRVVIEGKYDINDKALETRLIEEIVARTGFKLLERQALSVLMEEQAMSLTGLTEEDPSRTGKIAGVDAFLTITMRADKKKILLSEIKIVSTERASVLLNKEFKYRYSGGIKIGVGTSIATPLKYSIYGSYYNRVPLEYKTEAVSGYRQGWTFSVSQRLSRIKALEIGMRMVFLETDYDAKKGGTKQTFSVDTNQAMSGNIHVDLNFASIGVPKQSADVLVDAKLNVLRLFGVPKNQIYLTAGIGLGANNGSFYFTNNFNYSFGSSNAYAASLQKYGLEPVFSAGLEFIFADRAGLQAEYLNYFTRRESYDSLNQYSLASEPHKFRLSLMMYFGN